MVTRLHDLANGEGATSLCGDSRHQVRGRPVSLCAGGFSSTLMAPPCPPFPFVSEVMEIIGFMREHAEIDDEWPQELQEFLADCFEITPSERPSAEQLLE